ncbi:MAG: MOSC domain-containing protein [Hyphomonadaceae bacterium]
MAEPAAIGLLASVHLGRVAPLGPEGEPSGFVKHAVSGPVEVDAGGLAGDEQADRRNHGGSEKAVYGYALAHYEAWRRDFPEHHDKFGPGAVGENLAISGVTEADLCVGDVHAIGAALLQVCQPRQPCYKFALRFGDDRLPPAMTRNGRAGWYYRVLRGGRIESGDAVILYERPNPDFPFARLIDLISRRNGAQAEFVRLAQMAGLASQWQAYARQKLRGA